MYDFILVTPAYQGVDAITCWCVEKAHQAGLNFQWVLGKSGKGDALLPRDRSVAVTAFLEHGEADHMIFLDSDIVFEPIQLKMLNDNQKAGYDLIGGMYPVRSGTDNSSYFYKGIAPKGLGIHEIQFLSTGFMGISKYLLQKIVKEYKYSDGSPMPILHANTDGARSYPFFECKWAHIDTPDQDGTQDIWLSEDWDFCEKARAVGFKIYADTRIQLGHQSDVIRTFEDVKAFRKQKAKLESQITAAKKAKEQGASNEDLIDYVGQSAEEADA